MFKLSTKEKTLIHLADNLEKELEFSQKRNGPPIALSQKGIMRSASVSLMPLSLALKTLEKDGLVKRKRMHVRETGRFRNFFFLTFEGIQKAKELQDDVGRRRIKVREKNDLKEMKISKLIDYLKKTTMRPTKEGYSYLIKGEKPDRAYEVFKELLGKGYNGIVISDAPPKKIEEKYGIKKAIYWLSDTKGENILRPERLDFETMVTVSKFLRENEKPAILLEGFEHLSQVNGFDTCLKWIKTITDVVAKNNGILILPVNPVVLSEKELSLLSRNLEVYEPREVAPVEINYTNILKNITPEGYLDIRTILEPKKYVDYSERRPGIKYFVDREKELKEINDFLKSKSKILCVKGIAGIGKTALLSKFSEKIEMNVFWHKFTEFTTLRCLLTKISDFLSKMDRIKLENYLRGERFEVEEILILLEEELKGSNALFVFDDFQKASKEIVDFFRSFKDLETDVKIIILGRTIPSFYDRRDIMIKKNISEMMLTGLDKENSIKLLKHRKIEKDFERLYSITKGHPLMLELVTTETKTPAEDYIREEIIGKLNTQEKKALEIASVFRHLFPGEAIVNVTTYDTLDKLVDKSLMQRSDEIYGLHDIIKEHVSKRLSVNKKMKYHKMAAEYYGKEKGDGALLEAGYHLLKAGYQEKVVKMIIKAGETLIKKGYLNEVMSILKTLNLRRIPKHGLVRLLLLEGDIYEIEGERDKSLNQTNKALRLAEKLKNNELIAESYRKMGRIEVGRANYDKAVEQLQKALQISEASNDTRGTAEARYWMGKASWGRGKLDDAIRHLQTCLDLAEELGDERLQAMTYNDIGSVHHLKGEYKKSLELRMNCVEYFERTEDKYELARAENNIGAIYYDMNDYGKAIEWYEKCVKTSRESGIIRVVGYGLCNAASSYAELGEELEKAKKYTDEALDIFSKLGEKRMIGACHYCYGLIYHREKKWERSGECFEKALKIQEGIEDLNGLSYTHRHYGRMLADKGAKEKAREQFQKSIEVYEKLGNKKKIEEIKKEIEKL